MKRCAWMIAAVAGLTFAAQFVFAADAPATIGWRQNWTGRFPNAEPPTEWSRLSKGIVKDLRCLAGKPEGEAPAAGTPMPDGFIPEYLTGAADADDAALEKQVVKRASCNRDGDWNSYGGPDWFNSKGAAITYLYTPRAGKVTMLFDHVKGAVVLLNGQTVYENPQTSVSWMYSGNLSQYRFAASAWPRARSFELNLKQGWNRLLFKTTGNIHPWIVDEPSAPYEAKNIAWMTPLPGEGNGGAVIVGDKIFLLCEPDELVCLNKSDGKVLWRAANGYFEATPAAERKDERFVTVAQLSAEKLKATGDRRDELAKQIKDLLTAIDPKKFGMVLNDHAAVHWCINGACTTTPCSDGKSVYVWLTSGVAACYDLDGNRKWITRIDELVKNPDDRTGPYGYACSPALVGGRFIVSIGPYFGLDAKTGEVAWRTGEARGSMTGMVAAVIHGQEVMITLNGAVLRPSDGKVLWKYDPKEKSAQIHWATPIVVNDAVYFYTCGTYELTIEDFLAPEAVADPDAWKPAVRVVNNEPKWIGDINIASAPVYHDGIVYATSLDGHLYANDVKAGRLLYKQQLELKPFIHGNGVGCGAGLTVAGKYLYAFDNQGNCVVVETGPEFKPVARNSIETTLQRGYSFNPRENCTYSNPVFEGTRLYLRAERNLYCIGK